jgi:hypothetical protein
LDFVVKKGSNSRFALAGLMPRAGVLYTDDHVPSVTPTGLDQ